MIIKSLDGIIRWFFSIFSLSLATAAGNFMVINENLSRILLSLALIMIANVSLGGRENDKPNP